MDSREWIMLWRWRGRAWHTRGPRWHRVSAEQLSRRRQCLEWLNSRQRLVPGAVVPG